MKGTKKTIVGILIFGLLVGLVALLFGMAGPFYRTEVANLPLNIETPSNHKIAFTVDRSEDYLIEVHLESIFSEVKMDYILGDYLESGGGVINITWRIDANNSLITQGSNSSYGYSPIFSGDKSGLTIGTFKAEKNKNYTLSISTHNDSNDWNLAKPYVKVGLHPSKLENYILLQLLGILLTSIFGAILLLLFLRAIISNISNASNKSSNLTGEKNSPSS